MAHADDMVDITQTELEQLVSQDTAGISKAEKRVVGVNSAQAHGSRV